MRENIRVVNEGYALVHPQSYLYFDATGVSHVSQQPEGIPLPRWEGLPALSADRQAAGRDEGEGDPASVVSPPLSLLYPEGAPVKGEGAVLQTQDIF